MLLFSALVYLLHADLVVSPDNESEAYLHHEKEDPKKKKSIVKTKKKFKDGNVEIALGAVINPEMGIVNQDYKGKNKERDGCKPHFNVPYTNIWFQGKYMANGGWEAGYLIRFDPAVSGIEIDRNYIELTHKKFGEIQIGNQKSVHDLMAKLAQGNMPTFWIDGWHGDYFYNSEGGIYQGGELIGDAGKATKLNWISPSWSGLKFAISYTPSTKSVGKGLRNDNGFEKNDSESGNTGAWKNVKNEISDQPFGRHHVTLLALFDKSCKDWRFTTIGSVMLDQSYFKGDSDKVNNVRSWMVSALIGYKDVTLAGEFLNSGKSRLPKEGLKDNEDMFKKADEIDKKDYVIPVDPLFRKGDAGKAINTTLSWSITEKHKVGIGYQYTWRHFGDDGKGSKNLYSLGYSYKFFECATWYAEANYVRCKTEGKDAEKIDKEEDKRKNNGFLLLTGIRIEI